MDQGNGLAATPAVDPEITKISCYHRIPGVQFTHPDQTQVRKVRLAIRTAGRQLS
jgi:hypothetical protein